MIKTDDDTKLDMIGKYLELGGTMLAQHCKCGAPLFRYHGNVVCPICDSNGSNDAGNSNETAINSADMSNKNIPNKNSTVSPTSSIQQDQPVTTPSSHISPTSTHPPEQSAPQPPASSAISQTSVPYASENISHETHDFISNTIINKVVQLCLDLQRETDLGRIKQQMDAIKSGTKALKNLKKIS